MKIITHKTADGKELKLYSIQMVALAVNKDRQTLKKWEKKGLMPKAPFSRRRGRYIIRLYPEYFIKALCKVIKDFNIGRGVEVDPIITKSRIWDYIDKFKQGVLK